MTISPRMFDNVVSPLSYGTVAASQTGSTFGFTGRLGDFLAGLTVTPTTTSPGAVTIIDGATSIVVFAGGTNSLSNLAPFPIPLSMKSKNAGGWSITTGAGLSLVVIGDFT